MTDKPEPTADGFCPTCGALDDQTCVTPTGAARPNHKARRPSPPSAMTPQKGDTAACIHPCPCTSDQECRHDDCGDRACPACGEEMLLEDIEWATGMNGKTLVESLAEFGLVIRVR